MNLDYRFWSTVSLLASLGIPAGILTGNLLITGLGCGFSYLFLWRSLKSSRLKGKTETSKLIHSLMGDLIEIGAISAGFFVTESWAVVLALAAVGFRESFGSETESKMLDMPEELLGRLERIAILSLTFMAAFFNRYALLYGFIIVGAVAVLETLRQIFLFFK